VGTLGNAPLSYKLGRGGKYGEMQQAKEIKEKQSMTIIGHAIMVHQVYGRQ